ncbi:dolichyl-phosphate-mannose--protein mannosyltransferase [Streptomyces sp. NPDC002574]|uniref:dolichyl-phosphate-mannose--protein mannosyltransferase n=1 Tax=Streptomyces sp. NPDC002574 TaxID=3364652 RepID=UPI0036A9BD84
MTTHTATQTRAGQGPPGSGWGAAWLRGLRPFGYEARPWTDLRERLVPPFGTARAGWLGPLLVAVFAGLLRFWKLGQPHDVVFDETFYAKDSWSMLRLGYEGTWPDRKIADPDILGHSANLPLTDPGTFVAHPPMGKWMIALGEWGFGLDPFGWRFMSALVGTVSVLMLCRIGRRLFRSTALGCLAGGLMAVDGLHFVMSRVALLDVFVMFFVLAAFGSLLIDRDRARARLAAALPVGADGSAGPDAATGDRTGLGVRPWRLAAGVFLGLASAVKWNGLYFLAFFMIMTLLWDLGARRLAGSRRPYVAVLRKDFVPSVLSLLPVAVVTYLVTWTGWFMTDDGYGRHWADGRGGTWSWIPAPLRSLWHYEHAVYQFNVGLHTPHPYQSNPWSWLVLGRPTSFYYQSPKLGEDGCSAAEGCSRAILSLGTPALWWAACFALAYLLFRWALRRDWRAGAVLCAVAAGYLPWFNYQDRTIFSFYAVAFVPYVCLALAMALGALIGPPGGDERRRVWGTVAAGTLGLLVVGNFIYFFPIYTGQTIPYSAWHARMWLDSWI